MTATIFSSGGRGNNERGFLAFCSAWFPQFVEAKTLEKQPFYGLELHFWYITKVKQSGRQRGCTAVERCFLQHALELRQMCFLHSAVSMSVWVHGTMLPPGLKSGPASHRAEGAAFTFPHVAASGLLDTYGAQTDLRNKLSSNNQIIHVSQSNDRGMWADMSGTPS